MKRRTRDLVMFRTASRRAPWRSGPADLLDFSEWARLDSNQRPTDYEPHTLVECGGVASEIWL